MYLTQTEIAKIRTDITKINSESELLKDLISKDEVSTEKVNMTKGVNYYANKPDILDYDFRTYYVDGVSYTDQNASNQKIAHGYMKLMVDQKTAYLVSNPVTVNDADSKVEEVFDSDFHDLLNDWVTGTSNKGLEYLHPYYDAEGEFKYTIIPAEEIIPVYDTNYNSTLVEAIRYYPMDFIENGETVTRKRVEWWTDKDVTFYVENKNGTYIKDPNEDDNPRPHFRYFNTNNPSVKEGGNWGKVPFVQLWNNTEGTPDLQMVKTLIDDYDLNVSDFSNSLADLQEAIWVLKGYDGTDLAEFQKNLKKFKVMKVSEEGGAEPQTLDIPSTARDSHLDRLEENIYIFGQAVNMKTDRFGNSPSGVALKFMFSLLDLKTKQLERKLQKALKDFLWFVGQAFNVAVEGVTFTFDYSTIMNEAEIITNLVNSQGIIPKETIVSKHPYVDNTQDALDKLAEEEPQINLDNVE